MSKRQKLYEKSNIMKRKILSFVLITVLAISAFGTQITVSAEERSTPSGIPYSEISNELDSYIKTYEAGLASCQVAVFDKNGVITSNYYGFSDIENQIEADASTVYEWGSCSKLLVWTAVMQQWERGNIDLDTDIREYLPKEFLTKLQYAHEKITMKNLMSHNAGFQESFYEKQDGCREEFAGVTVEDENDISGIYLSKRTIDMGAVCFQKYIGGLFPWQKNAEGSYDMKLLGQNMNPEAKLFKVAENQYIMDNNGMQMFLYQSFDDKGNSKLEMMSTDYVAGGKQTVPMVFLVSILILGAICIVTLLIKIIVFLIRKIRKSDKHYNIQITFMQMLYAATVVLLFGYVSTTVTINHGMMAFVSIFAAILGIASLANGVILGVNTIKTKELKKRTLYLSIEFSVKRPSKIQSLFPLIWHLLISGAICLFCYFFKTCSIFF